MGKVDIHEYDQLVIKTNKFQTPVTREFMDDMPQEVQEQFLECMNIPFVKNLISPNRPYPKDLPKDKLGRAIIDITNPPIVEGTEYFTEVIREFKKNGEYIGVRPNGNPNSVYGKFLKRELNRCWDGMLRPDGMWIPGLMYWYLNYTPMEINVSDNSDSDYSERIVDFPRWWEGALWRFIYLYQARFGGQYNKFKGGQHAAELASRGKSKSYSIATIGSHDLIVGESRKSHHGRVCILTAYTKEYLENSKDGTLKKFMPILDHLALHTQFPRLKIVDSPNKMTWQMGYRDKATGAIMGSRNTFVAVSAKDDSDKLRGKRGTIMFEEFGSFKNLVKTYNSVRDSVEEGGRAFAQIYLVGTSGNKESDFSGARELVTSPRGYNIYALPNVYSKSPVVGSEISFFFPSYVNYGDKYYNKDGISDVTGAIREILMDRYTVKYTAKDPSTLTTRIAERCITPEEALIKVHSTVFPVNDINERKSQLMMDKNAFSHIKTGEFVFDNNGNITFQSTDRQPIREFPFQGDDTTGAIELSVMPVRDSEGKVPYNRYVAGMDPYDQDKAFASSSLGSWYIMDLVTEELVCWYTGRPRYAETFYEQCRRALLFYNAILNHENNKIGVHSYFKKMNSEYLLCETLEILIAKFGVTKKLGNASLGTYATGAINRFAITLIEKWMNKPRTILNTEGEEVQITNVGTIFDMGLLQEASMYDGYINCDRISALGMLMLIWEDRTSRFGDNMSRIDYNEGSTEVDTFLSDNYGSFRIK